VHDALAMDVIQHIGHRLQNARHFLAAERAPLFLVDAQELAQRCVHELHSQEGVAVGGLPGVVHLAHAAVAEIGGELSFSLKVLERARVLLAQHLKRHPALGGTLKSPVDHSSAAVAYLLVYLVGADDVTGLQMHLYIFTSGSSFCLPPPASRLLR